MGKNAQNKKLLTREFASGGVVFRKFGNETEWLVAKNNPSKEYPQEFWRLPKGWLDDRDGGLNPGPIAAGEIKAEEKDLMDGALREVGEEGGVEAKILGKIGTIKYFTNSSRGKVMKFVTFYLMEYVRDLPEGFGFETEKVDWLKFKDARDRITRENEKEVLSSAQKMLAPVA